MQIKEILIISLTLLNNNYYIVKFYILQFKKRFSRCLIHEMQKFKRNKNLKELTDSINKKRLYHEIKY
jgi:hypothetical protein